MGNEQTLVKKRNGTIRKYVQRYYTPKRLLRFMYYVYHRSFFYTFSIEGNQIYKLIMIHKSVFVRSKIRSYSF